LRLLAPWPKTEALTDTGWTSCSADEQGIVRIDTMPGQTLRFRPRPVWSQVRAQGTEQSFRFEDGAAVMRIEGAPGVSTGYQMPGPGGAAVTEIVWEVKGSPNAQYFVEVATSEGPRVTGWARSPGDWTQGKLELPDGASADSVVLYAQSDDGAPAFNAFRGVTLRFAGGTEQFPVDLQAHNPA